MITLHSALVVSNVMGKFMDALFDADGAYMICIHTHTHSSSSTSKAAWQFRAIEGISGEMNKSTLTSMNLMAFFALCVCALFGLGCRGSQR